MWVTLFCAGQVAAECPCPAVMAAPLRGAALRGLEPHLKARLYVSFNFFEDALASACINS